MQSIEEDKAPNKITVLQLISGLGVGGAERVVMELAGRLTHHSCNSFVVALNNDCRLMKQYSNVDFQVISIGMRKNPWAFIKVAAALITIVRREKVSLIHAHMFHALCLASICKITLPRLKLVFTSHNTKGFSWLRRMLIGMTKALRDVDVLFMAGQHCEMNASRTIIIPNGVQVRLAKAANMSGINTRRVLLFVGRLEPLKDPIALIRAFAAMRQKNCELWMAGDGFLRPEVEREVETLGINDRVRLLGIRHDVPQLLERVDCFVMSSRWEGLPMAILEAGAAALPVVAPPVGAIPMLLDDNCGYLVDVPELQSALDAVMDDYADATRRGKRLRNKILNKFSLDQICRAHADLYRSLVSNG
ncbi:glycosyltransferase [Candidatus Methylomirabilis sp.]|uniref:Glycosyltransferase n=1 Tax=Candidatus Methylomirabilis tolerans TaxID=3123416 RepID=A0AAJ1AG81_9BACT|nr:glycosyltransferase [Candidatus Methylomirabilis sp.]